MNGLRWSDRDIAVLLERYESDGPDKLSSDLGRSWDAVQKRASELGLHRRAHWTEIEDRRLMILWDQAYTLRWLARHFKRTPRAVYLRLMKLGYSRNDEALTAAERRTGFDLSTLYRIANWSGLRIRRRISVSGKRAMKRPQHVIDKDDLDEAIEAWMKTETIAAAARRIGHANHTVMRAVARLAKQSPADIPSNVRCGNQWRLPTEVVDRAMAARQEHAAR